MRVSRLKPLRHGHATLQRWSRALRAGLAWGIPRLAVRSVRPQKPPVRGTGVEQTESGSRPERTRVSRSRRTAASNRCTAAWLSALMGEIQQCAPKLGSRSGVPSRLIYSRGCSSVMYRSGPRAHAQRPAKATFSVRSSHKGTSACVSTPPPRRTSADVTMVVPTAAPFPQRLPSHAVHALG
jgi:hypothetical protein